MSDISLDAVRARIGAIEAQAGGSQALPHLGSTAEFEPFGDRYLAALDRRNRAGLQAPSSSTTPTYVAGSSNFSAGAFPASTFSGTSGSHGLAGVSEAKLNAAIAGQAAPPGARQPGGYGSLPVPESLKAFGNGKIPTDALTQLDGSRHRLYAPAAASWNNVVAAAAADGIELRITDSYRDYAEQVDLVERKGLYSEGGLGAKPGTSNHGWGMAVDADVTEERTRNWLQINGPRFGWIESVPREPWHWEFRPAQV
ncbi:MAG: D-alanyl-D-alanine carboxypeptidase family protein [Ilumatobacter sp.]